MVSLIFLQLLKTPYGMICHCLNSLQLLFVDCTQIVTLYISLDSSGINHAHLQIMRNPLLLTSKLYRFLIFICWFCWFVLGNQKKPNSRAPLYAGSSTRHLLNLDAILKPSPLLFQLV